MACRELWGCKLPTVGGHSHLGVGVQPRWMGRPGYNFAMPMPVCYVTRAEGQGGFAGFCTNQLFCLKFFHLVRWPSWNQGVELSSAIIGLQLWKAKHLDWIKQISDWQLTGAPAITGMKECQTPITAVKCGDWYYLLFCAAVLKVSAIGRCEHSQRCGICCACWSSGWWGLQRGKPGSSSPHDPVPPCRQNTEQEGTVQTCISKQFSKKAFHSLLYCCLFNFNKLLSQLHW